MFKVAGRVIAASIVNGGPSFPYLSPAVYKYLTSKSTENVLPDITRSDVVDYEVLQAIDKIDAATVQHTTPAAFKDLLVFEDVQDKVKEYFLEYIEKEADRLPGVLMFCTGVNKIPPLGFHSPDKITVLELQSECGPLLNANTCPQELELQCMHDNFEDFKESLNKALDIQGSGFGLNKRESVHV
ncbi:uncharacterized protein [Montipora foliosa]|uniref:uncharacterized protein n=1 Tax=Montipora foliosa TaxID=591990 RepID=UPI0035F14A90